MERDGQSKDGLVFGNDGVAPASGQVTSNISHQVLGVNCTVKSNRIWIKPCSFRFLWINASQIDHDWNSAGHIRHVDSTEYDSMLLVTNTQPKINA